jgi:hypothetical protein
METKVATHNTMVLELINSALKQLIDETQKMQDQLMENYYHYFQWNAKAIFINKIKIGYIKQAIELNDFNPIIKDFEKFLSHSFNIRSNSTCEIKNATTTWEYITKMELLEYFKGLEKVRKHESAEQND